MKRGDVVIIADPSGHFSGKARPALVVQSDLFNGSHASVSVCLITSHLTGLGLFRVPIPEGESSGLQRQSEIQIDKVQAVWTHRVSRHVGQLTDETMDAVDAALRRWLAL